MSKLPYLCFINSRNSGNSIVPLPSRSASIIKFRTSSSVGFSPMARITLSSSDVLMLPLPSFSFHSKFALTLTPQIFWSLRRILCIVFPQTRPNVPIWHFMEVLMIMYRRYRIFQHPWPRILHIFTINWKLKPSLVKLIKSFLQFCISHEFKIHFSVNLKSLSWGQLTATDVKSRLFSSPLPCDDWPPSLRSHCISSSYQDVGCPRVSLLFLIMFYMTFWRDWFSVSISDVSPKSTYRCHLSQKWDYTTETFLFLLLCNGHVYIVYH